MVQLPGLHFLCSTALASFLNQLLLEQEYGGTGLSLSISKRFVNLMQGNMWVESEVAKGSKFFFTITSQISHSTMEATSAKMAPFVNRTILFVDTLFNTMGVFDRVKELGLNVEALRYA